MNKKFNISVISKACGVLPHTLRAWESRYNMFIPERDEKGRRFYSEHDLKKAVLLAKLVEHGHAISSLANIPLDQLEQLAGSVESHEKVVGSSQKNIDSKKLLKYLEIYDLENVVKELQFIRLNTSSKDFILNTVLPMMREIGEKVADKKYTVTQEHIMSTIVRDQLSQISFPDIVTKNTHIAIATPEGNLHELAINIANILCRSHKFNTRYLGAAHPADCLAQAVNTLKSQLLVLGVVSSDAWDYDKNITQYLKQIDSYLNRDITVVLGGGSAKKFPKFQYISQVIVMPSFQEFDDYLEQLI